MSRSSLRTLCVRTLCVVSLLGCFASSARAADVQPPTVFDGAYQGLLVGGLTGLSVGYLFARQDGWHGSSDWKPLVYGAGIGALTGSVLGLTLGIVDMSQGKPGRNGYVMRDGLYGIPERGSSRISTSGSCNRAAERRTRCFMPFE